MAKTVLILSDTHTNSTVGLSLPSVDVDDGDKVLSKKSRRWLHSCFLDGLEQVEKRKKGEVVGILNGDIIETDAKNRSLQLISHNPIEAVEMTKEVLEPLYNLCEVAYTMRGTEAHGGLMSMYEEDVAKNFDNSVKNKESGKYTWEWLPLKVSGVTIDIAHHPKGNSSGRPQNRQNKVNAIAADTLFDYADEKELPPQIVIRSHLHVYQDSYQAYSVRAIITPALSLLTAHTRRIGINKSAPIGMIMVHCDNGRYEVDPILFPVKRQQWQVVK